MPADAVDSIAIGLMLFIVVGILGAFFLYLRTSYRKGGWKRVRTDLMIAVVVLLVGRRSGFTKTTKFRNLSMPSNTNSVEHFEEVWRIDVQD
jgi:hypothetical protein